jgi:penicillin-binding protein 1A
MADAYATIAAGGVWAAPYSITRIVDRTGRVIYQHAPRTHPALDPRDVAVLTNAMQGVVQYGTGVAANIGRPLAGKTGTTDNFADAWFIGFVPQLTTAVWVGYADSNHPMKDVHGIAVTGGTFPASIFARVMGPALAGQPVYPLTTASPDTLALVPYYDVPNADGSGAWHPGYATGNANAPASGSVAGAASNATGSTGATDPSTTTTSSSTPAQSSTAQSSTASSSTTSSSTTSTSQPSSSSTSTTAAGGNSTSNTGSGGSGGSGAGSGSTSSGGGSTTTTTAPSG